MADLRVFVVSDDALARTGLSSLLADRSGLAVAGQLAPGEPWPGWRADRPGQVAVWELDPGAPSGLDRLREVAEEGLPILAVISDEGQAAEALGAGARGVVFRDADADRLAAAVRAVGAGLLVLDEGLGAAVLRSRPAGPELLETLTPREQEVLQLLSLGLSNRAIAERLGISDHTAKFHVNSILGKLGAQTRTEAIAQAARLGLIVF